MSLSENINKSYNNSNIWIISGGQYIDDDLSGIVEDKIQGPYKEYQISAIGRYLINPNSIEVKKKLIGGEIHYKQGTLKKIRNSLRKFRSKNSNSDNKGPLVAPDVIVSRYKLRIPPMNDAEFESHLHNIYDQLRFYDTVTKKLDQLDPRNIFQIVGICEDIGGNFSYLKLQGSTEEKIKYLGNSISKEVGVILNKAYIAEGLFELRGYDFLSYNPSESYRLISYSCDGEQKACVLKDQDVVDFYLSECDLIKHLHLLEHSLKANPTLNKMFTLCIQGQATPIKLFFNKKLEIDYSKTPLPTIYQDVFKAQNVELNKRNLIKPILNYLQLGVSLHYFYLADSLEDKMLTHISVLHDFRALETLRKNLPHVYSEILKRAFSSEAGKFYLLDSINGYTNV